LSVTKAVRWVDLDGADNIRDMGGLSVTGGGRTRFGRLLRSGTLQELTVDDVAYLVDVVGVRTVVDLRLGEEAEREGSALSDLSAVRYLSLPLRSAGHVRADTVADASLDIVGHYLAFLEASAENIVTAVRTFADDVNLPAVFHCAAGKDRTGVLAAVVLDAIGVTRESIVADYTLTAQRLRQIDARLGRLETYREMLAVARGVRGASSADEESMAGFLGQLDAQYGGGACYLRTHGVSDGTLAALRLVLVEPAAVPDL
jgi:protein tyrosine/serine phosphatase